MAIQTESHTYPMAFATFMSSEELHRYHRVATCSMNLRSHLDVLVWLQGDMQQCIPHDILIAAWGNFKERNIHHDIISSLEGVRSLSSNPQTLTNLLIGLFQRWTQLDKRPYTLKAGEDSFTLQTSALPSRVDDALKQMQYAMVHGIIDERGKQDCIYVALGVTATYGRKELLAMASLLPYIDTALRQITHLPHQNAQLNGINLADSIQAAYEHKLSRREFEVLRWVAKGKTNAEIADILNISVFTVKNHMQRVLQKLDVANRAQAVSKFMPSSHNAQN